MKKMKLFGMMCMASVLVMGFSSCKKDKTETTSSFEFNLPDIEGTSPFDDGKAYVDMVAGKLKWYENDKVMVYSLDEDIANSKAEIYSGEANMSGQTVTHFTGTPLQAGSIGYFAFYPAEKANKNITENNRASFNVGADQANSVDLFAGTNYAGRIFMDPKGVVCATTCDANVNGTMKHIFGFANVRLKDSGNSGKKVTSVSITDPNMHLTGSISVEIPGLTNEVLTGMKSLGQNYKNGSVDAAYYASTLRGYLDQIGYMSTPDGNTVTLDCGSSVVINNAYKFFLIPIRPGALKDGFTVTVNYEGGASEPISVPADKKYIVIPGTYTNISIDLANNQVL